ncbi:MAG: ATP synthase subunit I [Planctomycetales bacterium]
MEMWEWMSLLTAAATGMTLGGFYFGSLWWTVRRATQARRPSRLLIASFLIRVTVFAVGCAAVSGGRGEGVFACLLGFLAARAIAIRIALPIRPDGAPPATAGAQTVKPWT